MNWKKIIFIVLIIIIPIVLIFGRFFIASLPKQKSMAIKAAQEYLEEKYTQKMVCSDSYLVLEPFDYTIVFYPENEPDLEFRVVVSTEFFVYADDYYVSYFEFHTRKQAQKIMSNIWEDELNIYVSVSGCGRYASHIPAEITEEMTAEEMEPYFKYNFSVTPNRVLNSNSKKEEAEKIFKFIKTIQTSPHHPEEILIWYFTGKDKNKEIAAKPETWAKRYLKFNRLKNITTIDQVITEMDRQLFETKE